MPAILSPRPRAHASCALLAAADVPSQPKPRRPVALCSTPVATQPRATCTRRRSKPYTARRRASQRAPRASDPLPMHPFDQLPWIAALDATPTNLWDMADLSQIPDRPSSPGLCCPKMILRRPPPDLIQTPPPRPTTPQCDTPAFPRPVSSRPTTPLSRFVPSRVLFHNLMPVLCESPNTDSGHDPCTSSSLQPSFFQLLSPRLN